MKILVGLSGGVDSAVAAYLLKQQGHQVVAGFMLNYLDESDPHCSTKADLESFYEVCRFLNIPYEILDFREEYETKVLHYIYESYLKGITPNPDVLCNTEVKFKLFLDEALRMGYDMIAMGHYAQIQLPVTSYQLPVMTMDQTLRNRKQVAGNRKLLRGLDNLKDQSYFLAGLDQFQLSKALFPIGGLHKTEVRKIALDIGLPNAERKDSQGLCFVGNVAMSDFLRSKIGIKPGNIMLADGMIVGRHDGAYQFTIGQRKGLKLNFQAYVTDIDIVSNVVVVTKDEQDDMLFRTRFALRSMHWISGEQPSLPLECKCKVRYRQDLQDCTVTSYQLGLGSSELPVTSQIIIHTKNPQKGVPNGQICVLYGGSDYNEVLGCGEIGGTDL